MNWREVPFVRLLLPFLFGILLSIHTPVEVPLWLSCTVLGGLLVGLGILTFTKTGFRYRWMYGTLLTCFLLSMGWQLTSLYNELNVQTHFAKYVSDANDVVGNVQRLQPTNTGKTRIELAIIGIRSADDTSWYAATGNLLVYADSSGLERIHLGDQLRLYGTIQRIEAPKNPKAFDFARYMHFRNIHYQLFVKPDNWQVLESASRLTPMLLAHQLRERCIRILRKHFPSENELAVASALTLGYRDEMTHEVRTAYANTGAMHVLAVSGLHVGFVYLGIGFLLGLIKIKRQGWRWVKAMLEIIAIWGFALLTGASPSVMRAATMFSFLIAGKALQRESNIYNTLAASAFLLLCLNPYYIMDVGFQLSYLAVLGIVYFQPKIYRLWYIPNPVGDYVWKLVAVSLAAQISTTPISLYYFHQFPLAFWLSGLVVVPVAVVILSGGFLLFITDFIPGWSWLLGKALWYLVALVNKAIFLIQQIPGSLITGIWVSFFAVLLMYGAILAFVITLNTRQARWILVGLSCLGFTLAMYAFAEWQANRQAQLVIYHVPRHTVVDYFEGKRLITLSDTEVSKQSVQFASQSYRWFRRINHIEEIPLEQSAVFQLGQRNIAIISEPWHPEAADEALRVDAILIRQSPYLSSVAKLTQIFNCEQIVADASNSRRKVQQWRAECDSLGILFHDINESGAFVMNLK